MNEEKINYCPYCGHELSIFQSSDSNDVLYEDAVRVVREARKASTSLIQQKLRVGYARAARMIEKMEVDGFVGSADGARPRSVLIK